MLAGSELVLECPVSQGVPAPEVNWYHGSDEVTRGYVSDDHSLTISHVIKGDAGLYTCKAFNTEGSAKIMVSSRDIYGISKLPLIQLILPYKVGCIRGS